MGVLTLLYHRVNNLKSDINQLAVNPDIFYNQMKYLKQNYRIVRLESDWSMIQENSICITFDDGYYDNFDTALPILEKVDIPATIFVATKQFEEGGLFWWDELEDLILVGNEFPDEFCLYDDIFQNTWVTKNSQDRKELYDTLHWLMKDKISISKRNLWLEQCRKWRKVADCVGQNVVISYQQKDIELMNHPLLTIGAHTVNHPVLSTLTKEEQNNEISCSKKILESKLGKEIKVFSYPFGTIEDYNKDSVELCKKNNISKAVSNFQGIWKKGMSNYEIPRVIVREGSMEYFENLIKQSFRG